MKLLLTIISDRDREPVSKALIEAKFRVTRISSTGGFFHRGMSTLMTGVEENQVDKAIDVIKTNLPTRTVEKMSRATIFVINVEDFKQL